MRYIKQFAIIAVISFAGEILNRLIPLPIPASIYGLLLMLLCLQLKLVKVEQVKETSSFLIEIMPMMFVAPGVALIDAAPTLRQYWWQFILIAVVTTVAVLAVSGWVTQGIIHLENRLRQRGDKK